jgi:tetratricopeptide (TPR) repeat protein
MMRKGVIVVAAGCLAFTGSPGCAKYRHPERQTAAAAAPLVPAASQPSPDDPSYFTLDQIAPVPRLPATRKRPTTAPAPLDALQDYAQGHAALARGDRNTAVNQLEKAAAVDPDSPEILEDLAKAYGATDKALQTYERALALDPDNLSLHEKLGRQYLIKNRVDDALLHFRLATQTTDYAEDDEAAAVVDFFLARTLQRKGYDRAALDQYARLVKRLDNPSISSRSNPELLSLLSQPEVLYAQVGELYEKHQEYAEAVRAYELAAERSPDNFDYQARLTRALVNVHRGDDARRRAQDLVTRFRANADSLKLLQEVYQRTGRPGDVIEALVALRKQRPGDSSLLFALADAYKQAGRLPDAERLLLDESRKPGADSAEIIRRLFTMYDERNDVEGAARLLTNALAANPDSLRQLLPLWAQLLKPTRANQLRPTLLQKLKVNPSAEAARLYWLSVDAMLWNRDAMARSALEQGAALKPPFPPIYRSLVADYWSRPDWDDAQKARESAQLARTATEQGNRALAAELEGLSLLRQKKPDQAAAKLAESIQLGNKAPDVQLTQARALREAGDERRGEQLLWKIVGDTPAYEDAYVELFRLYLDQGQPTKAVNVLGKWLAADPGNVDARVLRAQLMERAGRTESAEAELLDLFHDQPESPQILGALFQFYSSTHRIEEYINKLEEERKARPGNREAVQQLVEIYYDQKRLPEALRVLDAARDAVKTDPDLLYYVAHVYGRIDQKETEEKLLQEVVRLDPKHASANNDLGYTWTEEGRNLGQAEDLIRVAVNAEPDNQSFLDSLGWVLYKRSKFAEALPYFERAIGPASRPDPVVLDHMGDVLYRLSRKADAAKQWQRAQQRLGEPDQANSEREDLKKLRLQLMQKLRQQEKGQPVEVAPTAADSTPASTQAKN